MVGAGLKKVFWVEVGVPAAYMINRYPSIKTPEELWSKHPPSLDRLRVISCLAYAHIRQDKVEPRALRCMFLRL